MSKNAEAKNISARIKSVNSFYRSGEVEIFVKSDKEFEYVKDEDVKFSFAESVMSKKTSLQKVADELFWKVKNDFWDTEQIPYEYFAEMLRILTISLEIDEYFINISENKRAFFDAFTDDFFNFSDDQITNSFVKDKINLYTRKVIGYEETGFIKFARELMLICLCGINVLLMKQNSSNYQLALRYTHSLEKIINIIIEVEKESSPTSDRKALGLRGLNHFFEARCYFSLGEFRKAEYAFKKSASLYSEKMNLLISSTKEKDAETRMLALRRASLAEVQLANLYLIESRIDEALEIMERVSPLLEFATGKTMLAYCQLLKISIKRAKHSSDLDKLKSLEYDIRRCMNTLEENVGKSHTYYKAVIELSLIKIYQASHLSEDKKKEIYENCTNDLRKAIEFGDSRSNKFTNRRINVEALSMRSHIFRYLADIYPNKFEEYIEKAKEDVEKALQNSANLKQLKSDAQIAKGLIFRDLYEKYPPKKAMDGKKTSKKSSSLNKNADGTDYKIESRKCFLEALRSNFDDNNNRIASICHLRLSELETIHQNNYFKAKNLFENFLKYKHKIGHQYVLKFADSLEMKINNVKYEKFLFSVDPQESLNLNHWQTKLKNFLISEAVYRAALEHKNNLPKKRWRGEKIDKELEKDSDFANKKSVKKNATKQSLLADYIKEKVGITTNERYEKARDHLEDFEYWCDVLKGL